MAFLQYFDWFMQKYHKFDKNPWLKNVCKTAQNLGQIAFSSNLVKSNSLLKNNWATVYNSNSTIFQFPFFDNISMF